MNTCVAVKRMRILNKTSQKNAPFPATIRNFLDNFIMSRIDLPYYNGEEHEVLVAITGLDHGQIKHYFQNTRDRRMALLRAHVAQKVVLPTDIVWPSGLNLGDIKRRKPPVSKNSPKREADVDDKLTDVDLEPSRSQPNRIKSEPKMKPEPRIESTEVPSPKNRAKPEQDAEYKTPKKRSDKTKVSVDEPMMKLEPVTDDQPRGPSPTFNLNYDNKYHDGGIRIVMNEHGSSTDRDSPYLVNDVMLNDGCPPSVSSFHIDAGLTYDAMDPRYVHMLSNDLDRLECDEHH